MITWFVFSPESITTGQPIGEVNAMTDHEAAIIWARRQHGDDSRAVAHILRTNAGRYICTMAGQYMAMMPDGYSWKPVGQVFHVYRERKIVQ